MGSGSALLAFVPLSEPSLLPDFASSVGAGGAGSEEAELVGSALDDDCVDVAVPFSSVAVGDPPVKAVEVMVMSGPFSCAFTPCVSGVKLGLTS